MIFGFQKRFLGNRINQISKNIKRFGIKNENDVGKVQWCNKTNTCTNWKFIFCLQDSGKSEHSKSISTVDPTPDSNSISVWSRCVVNTLSIETVSV